MSRDSNKLTIILGKQRPQYSLAVGSYQFSVLSEKQLAEIWMQVIQNKVYCIQTETVKFMCMIMC